jgi:PAS domain S-box-containing protein
MERSSHSAGISKDVTEQKHAEERLQVSEERQRFILDSMPVAIYSSPLDPEIDTAWIGGDVKKVTGYTVEEYLSEPDFWRSRLHPDDVETVRNTYRSITLDHEAILEYRWKCRDGEYHWFQERTTLKQKKEQKEFLGIIIDITERKEMVRALQENESRYRSIVENLHQAYYEADSRAVFTYCNPELYLMTGFTEKDLIGSSALRLVAPEDRPVISDSYRTWKEEKREYSSIEFMAQMKNGEKYWMEQTTHFEFDEQGRFVKGTNIVKNIQKRKEAEAALLKSEIFFRSVWQHSASGMRITDLDGIVINTNKAYCDMVGIPESELIGAPFSVIYAEEERSRIIQKHRERFAGGNIPPFMQKKLQLWNGNIIWVEVSNSFVEFGGGQTLLLGVFTDITHRKQSELALLESEERWQFALEGAGDGVWDWNCVTNEVLFSHNWKAMLGYSDDEISSNLDEWSKRIHQDDLKRVTEALNHCLEQRDTILSK